jgi:hypothetical protein
LGDERLDEVASEAAGATGDEPDFGGGG